MSLVIFSKLTIRLDFELERKVKDTKVKKNRFSVIYTDRALAPESP